MTLETPPFVGPVQVIWSGTHRNWSSNDEAYIIGSSNLAQQHLNERTMEISLNSGFSTQDVANLLASKDDSAHRQLRVTKAGIVFLADAERDDDQRGIAFCLETWIAGRGYTGADAAKDTDWVKRVERVLRENWPNPSSEFIDSF